MTGQSVAAKILFCIPVTVLLLLGGCAPHPITKEGSDMPNAAITSLSLGYSGGMGLEANYTYSVGKDEDGCHLQASLNAGNIDIEKDISAEDYNSLVRPFDGVDLASWDNRNDNNGDIALDAATLYFTASFSDGTTCNARSLRQAPDGFSEAADAFQSLFREMIADELPADNNTTADY